MHLSFNSQFDKKKKSSQGRIQMFSSEKSKIAPQRVVLSKFFLEQKILRMKCSINIVDSFFLFRTFFHVWYPVEGGGERFNPQ